jgi:hypothetical protein
MIAMCASPADVAAAVTFAATNSLEVTVRWRPQHVWRGGRRRRLDDGPQPAQPANQTPPGGCAARPTGCACYSAGFDVVLIFEAATDESPETRALLRSKLAGRNEVMDAMIASLDGHLTVPVPQAQAMYRALGAAWWPEPAAGPARYPGAAAARRHSLPLPRLRPRHISDVQHQGDLVVTLCDLAHEELAEAGP